MKRFFLQFLILMTLFNGLSAKAKVEKIKSSDGMIIVSTDETGLYIEKKHDKKFVHVTVHVKGTDGENFSISTDEKTNKFNYPFVVKGKNYEVFVTMMDASWGNWTASKSARITAAGGAGDFKISYKTYKYDNEQTAIVFQDYKITEPEGVELNSLTYNGNVYYDQKPGKTDYGKVKWSFFSMEGNKLFLGKHTDCFVNTTFFVEIDAKVTYEGVNYSSRICHNMSSLFTDVHPVTNITVDNGILVPPFNLSTTDYEVRGTNKAVKINAEVLPVVAAPKRIYGLEPVDGSTENISFVFEDKEINYNFTFVENKHFTFDNKEYVQTFYDEFEGTELNPKNWKKSNEEERQPNMKGHGWWKNECSYLDGNGLLVIDAKQKGKMNMSGAIDSKGLFEQSHGYYEIKFKCDNTSGLWYAFWLMGDNDEAHVGNGATDAAEIDVFELVPNEPYGNGPNYFKTTINWDAYGTSHKAKGSPAYNPKNDFYDTWHVAKFVWGDVSYKLWLDDVLLYEMDASKIDEDHFGGMCNGVNYMIISSEFGDWGGPIKQNLIPAKMYIDYVKAGAEIK